MSMNLDGTELGNPNLVKIYEHIVFMCYPGGTIVEWDTVKDYTYRYDGGGTKLSIGILEDVLWATDSDNQVLTWDLNTGKFLNSRKLTRNVIVWFPWSRGLFFTCSDYLTFEDTKKLMELDDSILYHNYSQLACTWGNRLCVGMNQVLEFFDPVSCPDYPELDHYSKRMFPEFKVTSLAANGNYLYTGDVKGKIKIWSEHMTHFFSLIDTIDTGYPIEKLMLQNNCIRALVGVCIFTLQLEDHSNSRTLIEYESQSGQYNELFQFRGAVFAHGPGKVMIRITPYTIWSPLTHKSFARRQKNGIKTMILIARANAYPSVTPPMDILNIIFQYYVSITIGEEFIDDLAKRQGWDKNICRKLQKVWS